MALKINSFANFSLQKDTRQIMCLSIVTVQSTARVPVRPPGVAGHLSVFVALCWLSHTSELQAGNRPTASKCTSPASNSTRNFCIGS